VKLLETKHSFEPETAGLLYRGILVDRLQV